MASRFSATNLGLDQIFSGQTLENLSITDFYKQTDSQSITPGTTENISFNSMRSAIARFDSSETLTINNRSFLDISGQGDNFTQPYGMCWGQSGNYLYMIRNGDMARYTTSSPYSIASIVNGSKQLYALPVTSSYDGAAGSPFDYFAGRGLAINASGTEILASNSHAPSDELVKFTLQTPWSLTGTITISKEGTARAGAYWTGDDGSPPSALSAPGWPEQMAWYENGTKFMLLGGNYMEVRNCSSAYSLTGSTRHSMWNSTYGGSGAQSGMYIGTTGYSLDAAAFTRNGYVLWTISYVGFQGTANLFKFDLNTAYDPRTAWRRTVEASFWTTPANGSTDMWVQTDSSLIQWTFINSANNFLYQLNDISR